MLWLTGGPGCSSFSGLAYEIGPIKFEPFLYDESLPKLMINPYSWTKLASIIFVDQPIGTGFSYARTAKASPSSDLQVSDQLYEFLKKWLIDHPEFSSNPFYVGGDSYAGIIVPIVSQLISNGNAVGVEPKINLKLERTFESLLLMGLDFGLISNELYQSLKDTCKGEYYQIDPSNALCLRYMQTLNQLLSDLVFDHTLEKKCPFASPEPSKNFDGRISAIDTFNLKTEELKVQEPIPIKCRIDGYWLAYCWSNDKSVQEALHVHKGSIVEWIRCNRGLPYTTSVGDVVPYHANISMKGYRSLVYSGDHDLLVPHLATQAWIKSLNYHIIDDWRQWIVGGQVAGYTRTYANKMTFATVKGGGHIAQEYNPEECLAMLQRWISNEAL